MKYTLICLSVSLCSTFGTKAQSFESAFIQAHITKLNNAKAYTLKVAELMPEDKYGFKPSEEEMSFAKQLIHLAQNLCWLSSAYITQSKNPLTEADGTVTSKKEIEAIVSKAYDFAIDAAGKINPVALTDTVSFFAGPLSKLQIINLIEDHQTHHRAQLLVYLRMNGIKPPDYVGW